MYNISINERALHALDLKPRAVFGPLFRALECKTVHLGNDSMILKFAFSIVGISMLIGSVFVYRHNQSFINEAHKAQGTVVELIKSRGDMADVYTPIVSFTTHEGQKVEFTSSISSTTPSHSRGATVNILYLPQNPNKHKINDFSSIWGGFVVLISIGIGFLLFGFLFGYLEYADKN